MIFTLAAGLVSPQFSYALTAVLDAQGEATLNADVKPNIVINGNDFEIANVVKPKPTVQPLFTLVGPNGGDIWRVGEKHTISWSAENYPATASHRIFAYNQTTKENFEVKTVSGTKGKFVWVIPKNITSGIYRLKAPNNTEIQIYIFNSRSLLGNPDVNKDGRVNTDDLLLILNAWGKCAIPSPTQSVWCPDLSGPAGRPDGTINQYDLDVVIDNWTGNAGVEIVGSGEVTVGGGSPVYERPSIMKPIFDIFKPRPTEPARPIEPDTAIPTPKPNGQNVRPQVERPQYEKPTSVSGSGDERISTEARVTTDVTDSRRIRADITGDGRVNVNDLLAVINSWGKCKSDKCPADINLDKVVNGIDLTMVLRSWSR